MTMEEREKLYHEVWEEPMCTVCKRYGISDTGLKKRCIAVGIPLPPQGYWAKLRAGQKLSQPPLPELTRESKRRVSGYAVSYRKELKAFSDDELLSKEPLFIFSERTKEIIRQVRDSLKAPHKLCQPHSLIVEHESEMKARAKQAQLEERYKNQWNKPKEYYLFRRKKTLNIQVDTPRINRAYRIVNTLLVQIEELEGFASVTYYSGEDGGLIRLAGASWEFKLFERSSKPKKSNNDEHIYTLHMEFNSGPMWHNDNTVTMFFKDEKNHPLEDQMGEIVYMLFTTAGAQQQKYELYVRECKRHYEEEERKKELERIQQEEERNVKAALAEAHSYAKATELRAYAEAYKLACKQKDSWNDLTKEHFQWLLDKSDRLDPLKSH